MTVSIRHATINRQSKRDLSLCVDTQRCVSLLHESIAQHAKNRPDATAFVHNDERITFQALFARVSSLAHAFVKHGVHHGDRIGLFGAKGIDVTVGMYAAMAAGAAYVPLDPAMPRQRLARIINDCDLRAFVCDNDRYTTLQHALADVLADHPRDVVIVGRDLQSPSAARQTQLEFDQIDRDTFDGFPNRVILPSDLAYVMYTSGSTGMPKGLMHTHASGMAYAQLSVDLYSLTDDDRLANMAPLHFDMSTLEYLAAPLAGACTVIVGEEVARFPSSVTELMEREHITVWYSVPHAMVQMLHYGALDKRDLSQWRWMLLGGERIAVEDINQLMAKLPKLRVVNVYGPAEVNQCTHYELPRPLPMDITSVPIGQPWPDTEALIVDDAMAPVKNGESGELLIRTTTMMQGYWGRDDLNQRVFHDVEGAGGFKKRYLRTGDLVQESDAGDLVFLGRRDRQVKIRGYRIELDEIEAVISGHDGVEEGAAVLIEHPSRGVEIHARVTQVETAQIDLKGLRKRLLERLPRYAVPADVAIVDTFPRTTSLKINRRALKSAIEDTLVSEESTASATTGVKR